MNRLSIEDLKPFPPGMTGSGGAYGMTTPVGATPIKEKLKLFPAAHGVKVFKIEYPWATYFGTFQSYSFGEEIKDLPPKEIILRMLDALQEKDPEGFSQMARDLFTESVNALRSRNLNWDSTLADFITGWVATAELYISPDYDSVNEGFKEIEEGKGLPAEEFLKGLGFDI